MDDRVAIPQLVRLDCWVGNETFDIVDLTDNRRTQNEDKSQMPSNSNHHKRSISFYRLDKDGNLLKEVDKSHSKPYRRKKKKVSPNDIWSKRYGWFFEPGEKIPFVSD